MVMASNENFNTNTADGLLKVADAAKWLAVSPRKVWQLIEEKKLLPIRIGKSVRIHPLELRAFAEASR